MTPVGRLRQIMLAVGGTALIVSLLAIVARFVSPRPLDALFAVAAGIATAILLGCVLVIAAAGSYLDDQAWFSRTFKELRRWLSRPIRWGLGGAGLGALFSIALPSGLTTSAPTEISPGGWLAILGGALGMASGVLEDWRTLALKGSPAGAVGSSSGEGVDSGQPGA